MAHTAHKTADEYKEHFDDESVLSAKIKKLAGWIRESNHFTVFTGAGISTSCGIPDFRSGLNTKLETGAGAWTLGAAKQQRSKSAKVTSTAKAIPSPTHMALCELQKRGFLKYLISQNCDGLHRRSGFPPQNLSELHGNTNLEICQKCGKNYMRDFRTRSARHVHDHRTGRRCTIQGCGGELHDSIINFGENLPEEVFRLGKTNSAKSDLCIVLGSSLRVTPAADLPESVPSRKRGTPGRLIIVNLQSTPLDQRSVDSGGMRINGFCDDVMTRLMQELGLEIPKFILRRFVRLARSADGGFALDTIDQDGTPMSLLRQVQVPDGQPLLADKRNLGKPFLLPPGAPGARLSFYGHYMETDLDLPFDEAIQILKPGESAVYRIGWNVYERRWTECESSALVRPRHPLCDLIRPKAAKPARKVAKPPRKAAEPARAAAPAPKKAPEQPRLQLRIGNRHEAARAADGSSNTHKWTMYVAENEPGAVAAVTYQLHPTFKPNVVTVRQAPFEFGARGWGTFEVGVKVQLRDGSTTSLAHQLCFDQPDSSTVVTVPSRRRTS